MENVDGYTKQLAMTTTGGQSNDKYKEDVHKYPAAINEMLVANLLWVGRERDAVTEPVQKDGGKEKKKKKSFTFGLSFFSSR